MRLDRLPLQVRRAVEPFLTSEAPRTAVFDADGTLWRGDVGEDFLRYLGANALLPNAPPAVYARYEEKLAIDPLAAYGYAVQVMAGIEETVLRQLCTTFFSQRFAGRVFPFVAPLFAVLKDAKVAIWICSASPRWIVEAGAQAMGLEPSFVIGVDAEVRGGLLTDELKLPVTAGAGKVTWLERAGVRPGFAAGNGELDRDMLLAAAHRLVVAPPDGLDNALVLLGRERGWPILKT